MRCRPAARSRTAKRARRSCGRCCRSDREDALTRSKTVVVASLGTTQTLAWASSYYLPAVLGAPIASGLGVAPSGFFGIFSAALLFGAGGGPFVRRLIDPHGGGARLGPSDLVPSARA